MPQKKLWNLHYCHVIIFYLIYVDHLIENMLRTVSFFTFRTIEKLFFVLSYFRFYGMNFFYWNLMSWDTFIPNFSVFFRETRKKCLPGKFQENCPTEIFACHSKKEGIFGNKCFSRHQIPVEKIHLIESEVSQNKEQYSIGRNDNKLTVLKIFLIKWST